MEEYLMLTSIKIISIFQQILIKAFTGWPGMLQSPFQGKGDWRFRSFEQNWPLRRLSR